MPTFGQAATGHHNCLGWEEVPLTSSGAASWGSCSRLGVGGGGGQDQGRWGGLPHAPGLTRASVASGVTAQCLLDTQHFCATFQAKEHVLRKLGSAPFSAAVGPQ